MKRRGRRALFDPALALAVASAVALCACAPADEPTGSATEADERSGDAPQAVADGRERPRLIILISIDTLRADHLGLYGYERFTSPTLDTLALEGVVFDDANAAAPWTLPSTASILTGRFPASHRVISSKTRLPDDVPTVASMLAAEGYRTAAVVNVEWLKRDSFQLTREFEKYLWVASFLDRESPSTFVTDHALELIADAGDQPMFLFVHYFDLHSDYVAEPAYEKLFVTPYDGPADGTAWQLQRAVLDEDYIESCHQDYDPDHCLIGGIYSVDASVEKIHFEPDDVRHIEQLYDAQIRQLDAELGRFFSALRARGVLDETLLIVTSDHGEEFMDHGGFEHFLTTHQEILRVPLLIRGPGVPRGVRVSTPVSSVDLVPTILKAVGAEPPLSAEGLDLAPLWSGGSEAPFESRYLYGEAAGGISWNFFARGFYPVFQSVRQGSYKMIYESKGGTSALYDLATDPLEMTDISERQPEIAARLSAVMEQRRRLTASGESDASAEVSPEDLERLRALGYVP